MAQTFIEALLQLKTHINPHTLVVEIFDTTLLPINMKLTTEKLELNNVIN